MLYFILVTKFSDTGAYVVGSLIGRHKMIPRISPGKTWEGSAARSWFPPAASLLFCALVPGTSWQGMNWLHAMILGVLLSVAAVVGDLIESLFKREAGVKDSGQLLPRHRRHPRLAGQLAVQCADHVSLSAACADASIRMP